jgi:hypothetical protein
VSFILNVTCAECHIEVLYAECHIEVLYVECHYAECRYAECLGANNIINSWSGVRILTLATGNKKERKFPKV